MTTANDTLRAAPRWPAPPGYGEVVPLDRRRHAGIAVAAPRRWPFARRLQAIYLTVAELAAASRHYPIVFLPQRDAAPVPAALTGLGAGENLFVDEAGQWAEGCYLPAYVRRYPFCVVRLPARRQAVVCVDEGGIVRGGGAPLFDAHGEPLPAWRPYAGLIDGMEAARAATEAFAATLQRHRLLLPFTAQVLPRHDEPSHLTGMLRVDEERLHALPAVRLKALLSGGHLRAIHTHLISLDNFASLLDRRAAAAAAAA